MKYLLFILSINVFLMSCERNIDQSKTNQNKKTYAKIFNKLEHTQTGVTFSNNLTETDSLNYLSYAYMYMGGGVAAGDINNDGLVDLFFTGNMVSNKLYLNKGNLKFEDISSKANIAGDKRWFTGAPWQM